MTNIIYAFKFSLGYIYEIKRGPKNCQWYILTNGKPQPLAFKNRKDSLREFQDGTLIDVDTMIIKYSNNFYKADKCTSSDIQSCFK